MMNTSGINGGSLLCSDPTYSNWRGDGLNRLFAMFCLTLLSFNAFAIVKSLLRKREKISARLFVFAFCGNICSLTAAFLTTILRFQDSLTCEVRMWLFVMFQYGMTSSSYALLILISINIILTRKLAMLTQNEKKSLGKKILIVCFITIIVSMASSFTIFESHRLAIRTGLILQFVADLGSIAQCFRLSQIFRKISNQMNCQVNSSFIRQANQSRKTILPAVAICNVFKVMYYILTVSIKLANTDKSAFIILEHVKSIYYLVFFIVPCLHLYNIRNRNLKKVLPSSQEPIKLPKRCGGTNQMKIFTVEPKATIPIC